MLGVWSLTCAYVTSQRADFHKRYGKESKRTTPSHFAHDATTPPPAGRAELTHRLCGLDGHKLVVAFLPADVAEGPVVPGVLGDVADLVDRVVMQQDLHLAAFGGKHCCHNNDDNNNNNHSAAPSSVFSGVGWGGGLPALYNTRRAAPQCTLCWL